MSRLLLLSSVLAVTLVATLPAAYNSALSQPGTSLRIDVTGVTSADGHLLVALYTDPAFWTKPEGAAATAKVPARVGTVAVDFAGLAPGDYAIALLHDADDSGDMTTNIIGIPKETYGFGNDARAALSAPAFGESVVAVRGKTVTAVRLK